jgi:hypothetical protein
MTAAVVAGKPQRMLATGDDGWLEFCTCRRCRSPRCVPGCPRWSTRSSARPSASRSRATGTRVAVVLSVDDLAAIEETLAWLDGPDALRRAVEADAAVAAGDVSGRDEMAALMANRSRRHSA